jgi:hypothetical protein
MTYVRRCEQPEKQHVRVNKQYVLHKKQKKDEAQQLVVTVATTA